MRPSVISLRLLICLFCEFLGIEEYNIVLHLPVTPWWHTFAVHTVWRRRSRYRTACGDSARRQGRLSHTSSAGGTVADSAEFLGSCKIAFARAVRCSWFVVLRSKTTNDESGRKMRIAGNEMSQRVIGVRQNRCNRHSWRQSPSNATVESVLRGITNESMTKPGENE